MHVQGGAQGLNRYLKPKWLNICNLFGADVYVEETYLSFTGKKQKNGTIKGTVKMNMDFYLDDYEMSGRITVSSSYTGTQISTLGIASMNEKKATQLPGAFLNVIREKLDNAVRSSDMP